MPRLSIFLFALIAVPSVALGDTDDVEPEAGRYQIAFSLEGLYFLDTATGALWIKDGHGGWSQVDSPVKRKLKPSDTPTEAISLTLPKAGVTMPMVQREKRAIPGSSDTIWVLVGDITGGQVFVEVIDINGDYLLDRTSLKDKEFVKFKVNDTNVYLQVVEMVNNLLDEDICQIHVSLKKPKVEARSSDPIEVKKID